MTAHGTATALAPKHAELPSPSLLDTFRARCEARAYLVAICEYSLHEAVDQLQQAAEAYGLLGDIGQDAVQAIMADAFAVVSELPDHVPDPPLLDPEPPCDVASSTLDAAEYLIGISNPKRFETWLLQHSPAERTAIVDHINKNRDRP